MDNSSQQAPPEWLINSPACDIINCSKDQNDWVYHGSHQGQATPVICQHGADQEVVTMFEVVNQGQPRADIGKCPVCGHVHWITKDS